jgi:CubicO group peptidase (beta-lactamase class C family)
MSDVLHGHRDARFDKVASALSESIATGEEVGAAIAVDIDGESVLDIWGGHADSDKTVGWGEDTIVNVWSSTKTVTSLAALMLVDRGLLDLSAPVATYWPEFGANGKGGIQVRHVLSHTSGVSGWNTPFTTEDMYDWDKATTQLAAQAPWWEPGIMSGYHAHNQGHLIGELVRRVTGMSLKDYVRDEIAGPLGADFQIGARPEDAGRIAEIIAPPPLDLPLDLLPPDSPMVKTFTGPPPNAEAANTAAWRAAELGALNGHGNARSLSRVLSAISLGGMANGVRLLRRETIDAIFSVQADGVDAVLGVPLRWGVGYGLSKTETMPFVPDEKICFWGGWGGSMVLMNPDRRTTIAYVMNKMGPGVLGSERTARYASLIYEALA